MRIGRPDADRWPPRPLGGVAQAGLLLMALLVGAIAGDAGWHRSALGQLPRLASYIRALSRDEQLPTLTIDMAFADYTRLLDQREAALGSGVYEHDAEGYVPAVARVGGEAVEVGVQLREGPAASLGVDEKWPLVIRVTSDSALTTLPFGEATLQDPADNNWLAGWAFSEALRKEGLLSPRYGFVHLVLNGDARGIYAIREGIGGSLSADPETSAGIAVGYDAAPLWEAAAHFDGNRAAALADPVGGLSPYDFHGLTVEVEASAAALPEEEREAALGALHALQTGERRPSEIFDVVAYGRFLALVDLWGAPEATSPANMKYLYDSISGTLSPIATDANPLSGDDRLAPAATLGDPVLQMAYVQEAARLSSADYVGELREALGTEWDRLSAAMEDELPPTEAPWPQLERRQAILRQSLEPIQPVVAYMRPGMPPDYQVLEIDVANRLNLPIEVMGFDIGGATFVGAGADQVGQPATEMLAGLTAKVAIAAADDDGDVLRYTRFRLPLASIHAVDGEAVFDQDLAIRVAVRLLGAEQVQYVVAARGVPQPAAPEELP